MPNDDEKKVIDEEAIAEEEFVSDLEDTIENPLVYDGDKITVQDKKTSSEEGEKEELVGAIGSGELQADEPFNNEEALRSENMNEGDNPFSPDSESGKEFGGPSSAPLDDATETIAPTAPVDETASAPEAGSPSATPETTPITPEGTSSMPDAAVVTNAPTVDDLANGAAPKKKKGGLIAGIIIVVLLIGLAIGGAIFYMTHESKERAVSDAITGLMSANATQFDGTVTIASSASEAKALKDMTLTFKADSFGANFSGTGSLKITPETGKEVTIDVSAAYISGDGIYFKADNLKNVLNGDFLLQMMGAEGSTEEMGDMAKTIADLIGAMIEGIDGNWYKINSDAFASSQSSKDSYDCLTKGIDDLSKKENRDKLVDIYKSHPFIENDDKDGESKDGLKYYTVKTNSEKSKAFAEEAKNLDVIKDLKTCADNSSSSSSSEETDGDEEVTASVKLGITGWKHELKAIQGTVASKDTTMNVDVKIGYENKEVAAPTDSAKSIEDLLKDAMAGFAKSSLFKSMIDEQAKKMCAAQASNSTAYQKCIETTTEMLNEELMKQLMGSFVPSVSTTSFSL